MSEASVRSTACPHTHGSPRRTGGRALFLDRDGVLIADTGYPDDPNAIALLPGVAEGLRELQSAGWRLVVVSNQSGIARGKFSPDRLAQIHDRLIELLAAAGISLDALYFCPHHPEAPLPEYRSDCDHRKPGPGMLLSAAAALGLELEASWMIGDKASDVEAGRSAGCRTLRIGAGPSGADAVVGDLAAAARVILGPASGAGTGS